MRILDSTTVQAVLNHPATWMLMTVLLIVIMVAVNDFIRGFKK